MHYRSFAALPLLVLSVPALADSAADAAGDPIVVTATGHALPETEAASSISVITRADIDAVQGADLSRVLVRVPGVSFSRNGALGAQTSLFVRGGDSDQVLVLVDGVRVADLASPAGNFDLGTLALTSIDRIELLRGSNSVVWGSQAMAGVLAITTREANGAEGSVEHGAFNTTTIAATAGVKREAWAVSLDAGHEHSDGFAPKVGDAFDGGEDSWRVGGKARVALAEGLTLRANARYADSRLGIDQFGSYATQTTRDSSGGAALDYATGGLKLTTSASVADVRRHYTDTPYPSDYYGMEQNFALDGSLALPAKLRADFGASHEWDRAFDTYDTRHSARIDSGHLLLGYYSDAFSLAAGGRLDHHDRYGDHWSGGANAMVRVAGDLRARASWSQGFKAPSLYQLYAAYGTGNPNLKPQTSNAYEAGLEYGARDHGLFASATWFRRDTENQIYYDAGDWTYYNTAKARAVGVELEAGADLAANLRVTANYTWQSPRDVDNGRDLARRPRNTLNLAADWGVGHGVNLGADLRVVSSALDYGSAYNASVPVIHVLNGYVLGTLRGSVDLSSKVTLFGRIENIGDSAYQTAYGYNTAGRSAYVGVRAKL